MVLFGTRKQKTKAELWFGEANYDIVVRETANMII